jgi:hypothetical protein
LFPILLTNLSHPTTGHYLTICLKPSGIWDATCHSICTSFTVTWIFPKQPSRSQWWAWWEISPKYLCHRSATKWDGAQQFLPTAPSNLKEKLQLHTRGKQL